MAKDSRSNWAVFSGMTRVEQRALIFLVGVIAAGLVWQELQGDGPKRSDFVLHRGVHSSGTAARDSKPPGDEIPGPVDLNAADANVLSEALPGIGTVKAEAIVRYRESHGPFRRVEDLEQVPGIGPATVEAVRDCVAPLVSTPTVAVASDGGRGTDVPADGTRTAPEESALVDINSAGPEELDTLRGVGSVLARRIVEYRRTHGPFRRIEDLQGVKGIGPVVIRENRDRLVAGPGEPSRR